MSFGNELYHHRFFTPQKTQKPSIFIQSNDLLQQQRILDKFKKQGQLIRNQKLKQHINLQNNKNRHPRTVRIKTNNQEDNVQHQEHLNLKNVFLHNNIPTCAYYPEKHNCFCRCKKQHFNTNVSQNNNNNNCYSNIEKCPLQREKHKIYNKTQQQKQDNVYKLYVKKQNRNFINKKANKNQQKLLINKKELFKMQKALKQLSHKLQNNKKTFEEYINQCFKQRKVQRKLPIMNRMAYENSQQNKERYLIKINWDQIKKRVKTQNTMRDSALSKRYQNDFIDD